MAGGRQGSRVLAALLVVAVAGALHPIVGRADTGVASDRTVVSSVLLEATIVHDPFSITIRQDGETVVETAPVDPVDPLDLTGSVGPLGFALEAEVAAQTPFVGYGLFADVPLRWVHATTAEPQSDGSLLVHTTDPTRSFSLVIRPEPTGAISVEATLNDATGVAGTGAAFRNDPHQRFLGFGEQSASVDQTGRVVEQWNEEGPFSAGALRPYTDPVFGEDWQGPPPFGPASNYTMPWFISNHGYGFLLDSTWLNRFRLERSDVWRVETAEPALRWRVYPGPEPAQVLERFTSDPAVGRQPEPAEWFFGPWYQPTGPAAQREALISGWRRDESEGGLDVPVTVSQTYTHYLPCAAQSEADRDQAAAYHAWGYKVTTYVNSFVCQNHPGGAYETGDANGHFVQTVAGSTYPVPYAAYLDTPWSAIVDFTADGAAEWWQGLVSEALHHGYDGWMEDFGEYVPPDARLADGSTGIAAHNRYCTDYHRTSHQLTWPRYGPEFAQFVRCGYTGTAPYARIVWGGDPTEDDSEADGLAASVTQGLSMGLSGIAYWGTDIGGFHSLFTSDRTSAELLIRWLEVGAFNGIMRTQANGYGRPDQSGDHRAEVWDPEVLPHWRMLARLRTQLFPYTWAAAMEHQERGLPIMRHLALAHPAEPEAWGMGDPDRAEAARFQLLYGPDILVAPVVDMGATSRRVWLPPGGWVSFWDAVVYDPETGAFDPDPLGHAAVEGDTVIDVEAPLGRPPIFVRAGTCVPMLPADVDTLVSDSGFAHDDDVVTLADRRADIRHLPFAATC